MGEKPWQSCHSTFPDENYDRHGNKRESTPALFEPLPFTRQEKLKEIEREIKMRRALYSKWVSIGAMSKDEADRRITCMIEIAKDYGGTG